MRFNGGFEALKPRGTRLRGAVRRVANNGGQYRHCAAIDVDERLGDHQFDNLFAPMVRSWAEQLLYEGLPS